MVRLHQITLSRAQLDAIPETDRRLLILVAHAANELNILSKLFHFSAKANSSSPPLSQAENAQALVFGRVLTGKIHESWMLLQSAFFGQALSKSYEAQFDAEARGALTALKRYFSHNNIIADVRNSHAFHYSLDQIDAGYKSLVDGDPLVIYLSKANANTLFAFGDTIANRAMLETIRPGDHKAAFDALIDETSTAVANLNLVIAAMMVICLDTYVGRDLYSLGAVIVDVDSAPHAQHVSIPFFVEIDDVMGDA